jgi:hypothetical protein
MAVLMLSATSTFGRPPHKQALADYLGPFANPKLIDCRTCHLPDPQNVTKAATESEDKPHNAFGARVKAVKAELRKAGKPTTIADRLDALAEEDTDGDGVPNLIELLTGHFPGDPNDKPTIEEIAAAKQKLVDWQKWRVAYPWRPFEKPQRPVVPVVKNTSWVRNSIDAFVSAEQESRGLMPRPAAPKATLLRRVHLDLIGLPPTAEELHAFLSDESPEAYERVVNRLLDSPHYGERWGRHWMDIWRYADWAGWGQEVRDSQPHVWRWRDWIVESLNQDKSYDRMILEMLAGDEIAPEDPNVVRATGYLVRNYKRYSREKWLTDAVDHTFQGFLGVTIGCAKCHNHMFDPILQSEYYQVRSVFEPYNVRLDRVPGQPDTTKNGLARAFDATPDAKTYFLIRGDDRTPDKDRPMSPGVPEVLGGHWPSIEGKPVALTVAVPDKRDFVIQETVAAGAAAIPAARQSLESARRQTVTSFMPLLVGNPVERIVTLAGAQRAVDALAAAEAGLPLADTRYAALLATLQVEKLEDNGQKDSAMWQSLATAASVAQRTAAVCEARFNLLTAQQALHAAPMKARAEVAKKMAEAEKALAAAEANARLAPTFAYTKRQLATFPSVTTGRRTAFARWIADKENPLTARVAMNHIWLRHFGQAIEPSVFDFGRNGRRPTHPALLDWLAAEFMDRGWSMKAMHRLIVTSNTYRQASTPDAACLAIDPDNQYYWRMTPRRIEAEVARDCLFFVAGKLDITMGGPDIDRQQGLTLPRRSIYFQHAQEKQMEFLKIFDCAAVTECYQRRESIQPQQALALANSELALRHARLLARDVAAQVGPDATKFVNAVYERVLSRPPTRDELLTCTAFLQEQAGQHGQTVTKTSAGASDNGQAPANDPALRARENLVHVLLNHHEFVTTR